jgi:predicted Rossmann-fold nucleotide-binding protein
VDASAITRRKIVGVMGSGEHAFPALAEAAGRVIGAAGYHLLTGGGDGVMAAAARGFTGVPDRAGLSLGIVRADGVEHLGESRASRRYTPRGPNPYVELAIFTHLPYSGRRGKHDLSRNHINVLTATAVVVLPGGDGTASELELALEYGRPVVLFLGRETVAGASAEALQRRHGDRVSVATGEADLARRLRALLGDAR